MECGLELAGHFAGEAPGKLANRRINGEAKLKFLRYFAGFSWNGKAMSAVGSATLSATPQRAVRNPRARELARDLKVRLHRIWFAPLGLSVRDPHEWQNLIATSGLSGRASEEDWGNLFTELSKLPFFVLRDLAELGAAQLHIVSDSAEPNRLLGQVWTAVKASGDADDSSGRTDPSIYVCRGWDAFQPAGAVAADSAENSELGGSSPRPDQAAELSLTRKAAELGLTRKECDSMGTRAKPSSSRAIAPLSKSPSSPRPELSSIC